jgi:hypothetical protein
MIASQTKIIALGGILLAVVALSGLYVYATSTPASPGAGRIELKYTENFNDDKKVVEHSEAVFVARVTRFVEHTYLQDIMPVSVFEAEVIQSIKGDADPSLRCMAHGKIHVVYQWLTNRRSCAHIYTCMPTWNYFPAAVSRCNKAQCMPTDRKVGAEGTIRLVQDAQFYYDNEGWRLMQPGETYVFAASYDEGDNGGPEGYVILSHANGSKLLNKDAKKSKDELATLADKDEKVKAWKEAAKK